MTVFNTELERLTERRLTADLFTDYQLGGARENVDAARSGTLFGTWVGTSFLTRIVPEVEALAIPFAFPDRALAFRVIDGPVGERLQARFGERGFVVLGWMELGHRHVTNSRRPIAALEDFRGLKIRLQPNETHLATFRALGANPVTMDINELYSALQQGVVDGQENPFTVISANRFPEVQRHLSATGHFFEFIPVLANRTQFNALRPEYQAAVRQAAATAIVQQRASAAAASDAALADLRAKGMIVTEVSPSFQADMRRATASIVDDVRRRAGAEITAMVLRGAGIGN